MTDLHNLPDRLSASGSSAKYSRLEAEISAMQRNSSTYCDEPEDSADYRVSASAQRLSLLLPVDSGSRISEVPHVAKAVHSTAVARPMAHKRARASLQPTLISLPLKSS